MTQAEVPDDWPAVGPVRRIVRWLLGVALGLQTLVLASSSVVGLPEGKPVWLTVAGLVILVPSLGYGWWMLARGTMRQAVPGLRPKDAGSWRERLRLRRTLLAGGELGDDDRRRIAVQLTTLPSLRWVTALVGSMTGMNLVTTSSGVDGSRLGITLLVMGSAPVLLLLFVIGTLLWLWPVRRAAAAVGALPVVVDGVRATTG